MIRLLAPVVIVVSLGIGLLGCGGPSEKSTRSVATDSESAAEKLGSIDDLQAAGGEFGPRDKMPGAPLYAQHCATCHSGAVPKAPHIVWLEMMTASAVLGAMNEGVMQQQSSHLSQAQRRHIAEYLTQQSVDASLEAAPIAMCSGDAATFDRSSAVAKAGWGYDTNRYYSPETAGLSAEDVPRLKLAWAFAYPGALRARSQPSVAYGAIYTGSQDGTVYAFDLATGCARWTFSASAEVRTGIVVVEPKGGEVPLVVFGDILARAYAVDALTGELVWSRKVDDHPSATITGTPAATDSHVFIPVSSLEVTAAADPNYPCCSFRGKVQALDVVTGDVAWTHYTIPEPPKRVGETRLGTAILAPSGAPTWASPTIDHKRNRLYIGTGENYSSPSDSNSDAVIAIDMTTGDRVWQRQTISGDAWNVACMLEDNPNCPEENGPDFDHGSSILLVTLPDGRDVLAAGTKEGKVISLDPDKQGALLWTVTVGRGSIQGGVHFGMAADGATIYVPINDMDETYDGALHDKSASRPGVHAVDAFSGQILWSHVQEDVCPNDKQYCDPGVSAPISAIAGAVIAGHLDGYMRAYAKNDGRVLWEYDTTVPVEAVNGLQAWGGGMSGGGPVIANGYVVVNSGYGLYFHEAGNMLAVFSAAES